VFSSIIVKLADRRGKCCCGFIPHGTSSGSELLAVKGLDLAQLDHPVHTDASSRPSFTSVGIMQYRERTPLHDTPPIEPCIHTQPQWASCLQRGVTVVDRQTWTPPLQAIGAVSISMARSVISSQWQAMHLCSRMGGNIALDSRRSDSGHQPLAPNLVLRKRPYRIRTGKAIQQPKLKAPFHLIPC